MASLRKIVLALLATCCMMSAAAPMAQAASRAGEHGVVNGADGGQSIHVDMAEPMEGDTIVFPVTLQAYRYGNGRITSQPAGINCGDDCAQEFARGTQVTLTAVPSEGHELTGWGDACSGKEPTCTITLQNYTSVYASFDPVFYRLKLFKSGTGFGTIAGVGEHDLYGNYDFSCDQECPYDSRDVIHGTHLALSAIPSPGYVFAGWSGGCTGLLPCNTTMLAAKEITATFSLPGHTVITNKLGDGSGAVTSDPSGIDCGTDCGALFAHGEAVTLSAVPDPGSIFAGWAGACNGASPTCAFITDGDRQVAATFIAEQPGEHALTVVKTGSGGGVVISDPEGIDCGNDCVESYRHGTEVNLTATADPGSVFSGWSGICTSTDVCSVTLEAAELVTATFTVDPGENAVFLPTLQR